MVEKVDGRSRKIRVSRDLSYLVIAKNALFQMLRTAPVACTPGFWFAGSSTTSCRHPSTEDLAQSARWVPELGHSSRLHSKAVLDAYIFVMLPSLGPVSCN